MVGGMTSRTVIDTVLGRLEGGLAIDGRKRVGVGDLCSCTSLDVVKLDVVDLG